MNKIRQWYMSNYTEITWFLIGLLVASGIDSLVRGFYVNAGVSFLFAYLNYIFSKK